MLQVLGRPLFCTVIVPLSFDKLTEPPASICDKLAFTICEWSEVSISSITLNDDVLLFSELKYKPVPLLRTLNSSTEFSDTGTFATMRPSGVIIDTLETLFFRPYNSIFIEGSGT
jgi:hypothetical protein